MYLLTCYVLIFRCYQNQITVKTRSYYLLPIEIRNHLSKIRPQSIWLIKRKKYLMSLQMLSLKSSLWLTISKGLSFLISIWQLLCLREPMPPCVGNDMQAGDHFHDAEVGVESGHTNSLSSIPSHTLRNTRSHRMNSLSTISIMGRISYRTAVFRP